MTVITIPGSFNQVSVLPVLGGTTYVDKSKRFGMNNNTSQFYEYDMITGRIDWFTTGEGSYNNIDTMPGLYIGRPMFSLSYPGYPATMYARGDPVRQTAGNVENFLGSYFTPNEYGFLYSSTNDQYVLKLSNLGQENLYTYPTNAVMSTFDDGYRRFVLRGVYFDIYPTGYNGAVRVPGAYDANNYQFPIMHDPYFGGVAYYGGNAFLLALSTSRNTYILGTGGLNTSYINSLYFDGSSLYANAGAVYKYSLPIFDYLISEIDEPRNFRLSNFHRPVSVFGNFKT